MMPNDIAKPETRMYRLVAERIEHLVRAQGLGVGARLPGERELAANLADHRAIFSAVAACDEAGARQAMRAHLARVHRTLSGG